MTPFPNGETVTRLRATTVTDPYSSEPTAESWATPIELDIPGCGVAQSGSAEPLQTARQAVDADFDVYMPAGVDVTAQDRLRIRGQVCEVAGQPFTWTNPFSGWTPGLVVQAKVREG